MSRDTIPRRAAAALLAAVLAAVGAPCPVGAAPDYAPPASYPAANWYVFRTPGGARIDGASFRAMICGADSSIASNQVDFMWDATRKAYYTAAGSVRRDGCFDVYRIDGPDTLYVAGAWLHGMAVAYRAVDDTCIVAAGISGTKIIDGTLRSDGYADSSLHGDKLQPGTVDSWALNQPLPTLTVTDLAAATVATNALTAAGHLYGATISSTGSATVGDRSGTDSLTVIGPIKSGTGGVAGSVAISDGSANTFTVSGLPIGSDVTMKLPSDGGITDTLANRAYARAQCLAMPELWRRRPFWFVDFSAAPSSYNYGPLWPMFGAQVASGTSTTVQGTANHPGVVHIASSTSAGSGYTYATAIATDRILAGGEVCEFIFTVERTTDVTVRMGYIDTYTSAACTDGVWIDIVGTTLRGYTDNDGSAPTSTGTTYTISASTWYRARVDVNSGATGVTFTLWNGAGTVLWTDTTTPSDMPTGASDYLGVGIIATHSGTAVYTLLTLDWVACWMEDRWLLR